MGETLSRQTVQHFLNDFSEPIMTDRKFPPLPDPLRRTVLRAGAGAIALPLLHACGTSAPPDGALPPDDVGDTPPLPQPTPGTHPPRGAHVSFVDDPTSTRTVTWFTDGSDSAGTYVEYSFVDAETTEYELVDLALDQREEGNSSEVFEVEALTHAATITGVPEGKAIAYRVGSDGGGWTATRLLPPNPERDRFRFCHYGDQSSSEAAVAVTNGVISRNPDLLWIAGDLSYANGDQPVWDTWFDMLEPLASRIPVMTSPGNHEAKDGGGAGYLSRVSQPGQSAYYGFDYGNIHFSVSTAGCLLEGVASAVELLAELVQLEADLAQAALRRALGEIDFIAVVQHYTIWTNEDGRDPFNLSLVLLQEHILLRYGVDLLLVGHDHIYERSHPMAYGRAVDGGYVQITQGGGGQSLYDLLETPRGNWSAHNQLCHGFTEYEVDGPTIRGTTYTVEDADIVLFDDGRLEVIDSFELTARSAAERAKFAKPARKRSEIVSEADWADIVRHTLVRNQLHDAIETGSVVGAGM